MPTPLPIDPHLPRIVAAVRERGVAIVVAEPGAGKTTRVPPALLQLGRVALLQPRRIAARALARRIASEQGMRLGQDVGWHVRFERRFERDTRLIVMTEGILTRRLQDDPLLEDFGVVVLDEVHERSLHVDLALALTRQARLARPDLKLVVMSATIDAGPMAAYLGGAPIVEVPGRAHPVEIEHADLSIEDGVRRALRDAKGDVLAFLPGAPEIRRAQSRLGDVTSADVVALHGSLDADEQDRAIRPGPRRKVILATNVAETSLTVEGVTDVVDSGQVKVLRFDPATGLDRLSLERIPRSSATQRAGRAGRTGPGRALRLWDARLALRDFAEPEIARVDLAGPFLDVLAWGGDPLAMEWLEAPPEDHARAAMDLLRRLGAVEGTKLTELGAILRRFPLHPRLARVLVDAGGSPRATLACALLAERLPSRAGDAATTDSDVLSLADDPARLPHAARESARDVARIARDVLGNERDASDEELRRALLAGFPDRVARRREPRSPKLLLASGVGAVLGRESGVRDAEWLLALDVQQPPQGGEAIVRVASRVEREWLQGDSNALEHALDANGRVRAKRVEKLGALVLAERACEPDPVAAQALLAASVVVSDDDVTWERRARIAGVELEAVALRRAACEGRTSPPTESLAQLLPHSTRATIDRLSPAALTVPSGRTHELDYRADGSVVLAVKLQELFGLASSPRVGVRSEPVVLELLSPAGRPVQTTRDLASFWERTYPEVRKELRARYPKHPWPDDPWTATPTHRTVKRKT